MTRFDVDYGFFDFEEEVRKHRYFRTSKAETFLKALAANSTGRTFHVPKGTTFYRAQIGHPEFDKRLIGTDAYWLVPHPPERMKPLDQRAMEGRANATGISALYMATAFETALLEVRPWIGSRVTVAEVFLKDDVNLVNCFDTKHDGYVVNTDPDLTEQERADIVWSNIDTAFAVPTQRSDDRADYAVTQTLAEYFKISGFDGVMYHSKFGEQGRNIAIFDPDIIEIGACVLHEITSLSCEHKAVTPLPYKLGPTLSK